MGVLLGEGHDDVPEVGQGLVDILGLSQSHPLAPAVFYSLTASKINLKRAFNFQYVCYILESKLKFSDLFFYGEL